MSSDEAVQSTNDDASQCKRCAVQLGYWEDSYISLFIKGCERKAPEINRGYYARVRGVQIFVEQFTEITGNRAQIINLGSGFDTLFWRLKDSGLNLANFVDMDFPSVTAKKCSAIKRNKKLLESICSEDGEIRLSLCATDLHTDKYHIVSCDLRNVKEVERKLMEAGVSVEMPTLFITECVLVYIDPSAVARLLSWVAHAFSDALFVNYEQVNMGDKFGSVMLNNLRARGCPLSGFTACESLETQTNRFLVAGWLKSVAWDMVQVYEALPTEDRLRVEKIELLDEGELLVQLFQHYCIAVAWNSQLFNCIELSTGK